MRRAVLVMAMAVWMAAGAAPARADRVPANCSNNGLGVSISRDVVGFPGSVTVRPGDVIDYDVFVRNDASRAPA
jgi:hypothetical protein